MSQTLSEGVKGAAAGLVIGCVGALGPVADAAAAEPDISSIVITAARRPMPDIDAPASLSLVRRSDIEARGADNVLDALRGEAGVSLQGRAIGGRQVLSLRGLESRHTLFLIDGRRIGASDGLIGHSDFQYDWMAAEDIERIEVVRGPLSVLYGSDAMGGVVQVIRREPGLRWRGSASLDGRQAAGERGGNGHRVAASIDGPATATLGLRAGAARSEREKIASPADARISELEGRRKQDGWFGFVWHPAKGHRIDADLRGGEEDRVADARERGGARRYHVTENHIRRSLASIGWEADWSAANTVTTTTTTMLRAYRASIEVENRRSAGVAINPPQRIDDQVLEGQASHAAGAHTWTPGFEARDETLHDPGLPGGRSTARQRSLFVQDEWAVSPALALTAGLRYDRHALFGSEWSPRVYGVWRAAAGVVVKGGWGHGFKAPNLKQIVPGSRREGPNEFLGNPALRPEVSDAFEIGIGWQAEGPQRSRRAAQAVLFEQRVRELIEVRFVAAGAAPGTGTYTYENLARARLRGLEAALVEPLARWLDLRLSYQYLDARSGDGGGDGRRLERRPRHSATLALDATQGPWRAGLRVEHSADQRLPASTPGAPTVAAPELVFVGAQLTRTLSPWLEASLGVDNLGDVRLVEKSPLFQQAEAPRTWRLVLRGRW